MDDRIRWEKIPSPTIDNNSRKMNEELGYQGQIIPRFGGGLELVKKVD